MARVDEESHSFTCHPHVYPNDNRPKPNVQFETRCVSLALQYFQLTGARVF